MSHQPATIDPQVVTVHVTVPTPVLLRTVPVIYYVFDVLHLDGASTLELPYQQRRQLLTDLSLGGDAVRVPRHFVDVDGGHVLQTAELAGLEGVVAKRLNSPYDPAAAPPTGSRCLLSARTV